MDAAEEIMWEYAAQAGIVPMVGMSETPDHIREDLGRWLRRRAMPCPHSVQVVLDDVVFRVVGRADAWCTACAVVARIPELVSTCARCGHPIRADGIQKAFTLAGHVIIFAAWCGGCWKEEKQ